MGRRPDASGSRNGAQRHRSTRARSQTPPKKSNLNNARGSEARRKRVESAHQSAEQFETRNADQRIRIAGSRAQEHQEQRDERLRQTIMRTRAAREQNIATARVQERQRQRESRSS
ncbi:unnamed protein product [Parnassius apollo]|uniref:(apollo) hypothetical protein n=1 Tax=Parnassius apollo TaxID=110799 RepID=A0A8S3W562_PARAO|nr:unnamed protein product [Parnassius apollo]